MADEYLGVGWGFPVKLDEAGRVSVARYEDSIRQSIEIILHTAPGERQMRPDFGCEIVSLVFAENNMSTAGMASHYVQEALTRWEPRIELIGVRAIPDRESRERLDVYIDYRVIRTNSIFNLVYPFYLTEGVGG